ncbi:hypothetical protein ACLB2K_031061 [Fragaria x ananassa]
MVKMMMHKSVLSFSGCYSYRSSSSTRGKPFLHSTLSTALFHSQPSNPSKSGETHLEPRVSNVEDALKVFDEMLLRRPLPSVFRFTQVLAPLVKLKHYPTVLSLNSQMQGVCNLGHWKEAKRLLYEMANQGIFPDVFTFSILVDALCKDGMVVQAKSVVQIMIQRGIEPNTITYSSLMDGHCL